MCGLRPILLLAGFGLGGAAWPGLAEAQIQALPPNTTYDQRFLGDAITEPSVLAEPETGMVESDAPSFLDDSAPYLQREMLEGAASSGSGEDWRWQILPNGLLYRNYLANTQEPRLGTLFFYEQDRDWLWDASLGGHIGILRIGSTDPILGEGFQLDAEGAAFVRLDLEENRDVDSTDYHFGFPLTFRSGMWEAKLGYYHLCSHLSDEWLLKYPTWHRLNYVRDSIVLGLALRPVPDLRIYAEADWGVIFCDDGAEKWHFQFGIDYSPMRVTGWMADPFFAINARIQEENDFSGNFTVQTGWQWRNQDGHLLRMGFHYFNGKSNQFQFYQLHEEQFGVGIWYDF